MYRSQLKQRWILSPVAPIDITVDLRAEMMQILGASYLEVVLGTHVLAQGEIGVVLGDRIRWQTTYKN